MIDIMKGIMDLIANRLSLKDYIIFESVPICTGNVKAVFDEMVYRGLNKKYKLIWWPSKKPCLDKLINVIYPNENKRIDGLLFKYYKKRAKCIICENRFVESYRKDQMSFYLGHGTPLKDASSYYRMPKKIDYFVIASNRVEDICKRVFCVSEDTQIAALGLPRNDEFKKKKVRLDEIFQGGFSKFVAWYPTFRQQIDNRLQYDGEALPIINDPKAADKINELAKKLNLLIIIKPHFAQDVNYIKKIKLSNIRFIDDDFFVETGMTSYRFIGSCDALLTDYSSVYYDYLLCNKPVGMILEDIEGYTSSVRLIDEFEYLSSAATKIYSCNDLERFLIDLSNGKDELEDKRNEICRFINRSLDGKNTERVTQFIISKAGL